MASEYASDLSGIHGDREEVMSTLPKVKAWEGGDYDYFRYQGFWYAKVFLRGLIWAQQTLSARDSDIFLATSPKCGTTWGKALMSAIQNRNHQSHPLLTNNPHACVPYLEFQASNENPLLYLESLPSPRVFATHTSYASLPDSILKTSGARIVYITRNPKDVLVSLWKFTLKGGQQLSADSQVALPLSVEEAFESFCKGESTAGPYWDHVLGYWEASKENPDKVLFLKYEDMKEDTEGCVKLLAEFMRLPFSMEEERQGVVREVVNLCSFENLSNLEVNKSGTFGSRTSKRLDNSLFFRKGEVGDSINYLTVDMIKHLDNITEKKLGTAGLKF